VAAAASPGRWARLMVAARQRRIAGRRLRRMI
jgi:hypothetical protein